MRNFEGVTKGVLWGGLRDGDSQLFKADRMMSLERLDYFWGGGGGAGCAGNRSLFCSEIGACHDFLRLCTLFSVSPSECGGVKMFIHRIPPENIVEQKRPLVSIHTVIKRGASTYGEAHYHHEMYTLISPYLKVCYRLGIPFAFDESPSSDMPET